MSHPLRFPGPARCLGGLILIALFCFALCAASSPAAAESTASKPGRKRFFTAEEIFRLLPPSIFDYTPFPLDEDGKETLLENGFTSDWAITRNHPNTLVIAAMSIVESQVMVHLFRTGLNGIAVTGAKTDDGCAAELWSFDESGHIVPCPEPENPALEDFFTDPSALPENVAPTFNLCLGDGKLEVHPRFWTDTGALEITPDKTVFYTWDGNTFIKQAALAP